jgi:hypothetical protein
MGNEPNDEGISQYCGFFHLYCHGGGGGGDAVVAIVVAGGPAGGGFVRILDPQPPYPARIIHFIYSHLRSQILVKWLVLPHADLSMATTTVAPEDHRWIIIVIGLTITAVYN